MRTPLQSIFTSIILLFFLISLSSLCYAQTLNAHVDRTNITMGETLTLTIQTNNSQASQPDLSPLNQDFNLLGVSSSSQISIINFKRTTSKSWVITLLPKKIGTAIIPPLNLKGSKSQAINIHVTKAPTTLRHLGHKNNQTITMTATVDHSDSFIGAQILYTLEVRSSTLISQARLFPPQLKNATIKQAGKDIVFQRLVKGQRIQVLQRHYVITPNNAGKVTVQPATMIAYIQPSLSQTPANNIFDLSLNNINMAAPKQVSLQAKPIKLNVEAIPAKQQALPSAWNLSVTNHWSGTVTSWHVGTPLTRRITIKAQGLDATALPDITVAHQAGINLYPDQQQQKQYIQNNSIWSQASKQFAIIPTHAGPLTLPPIEVRWWNMSLQQAQTSQIPAQTINILPALNPITPTKTAPKASPDIIKQSNIVKPSTLALPKHHRFPIWFWLTLTFGILWLITLFIMWHRKKPPLRHTKGELNLNQLKKSCLSNNAENIHKNLLDWARNYFKQPQLNSIEVIRDRLSDPEISTYLDQLQQSLWAKETNPFTHGADLFDAIKKYCSQKNKQQNQHNNNNELPPLYQ